MYQTQLPQAETTHKCNLKVFVGGLAHSTANTDLQDYFEKFGLIEGCEVRRRNKPPHKCRGFATITAADQNTYNNILTHQEHHLMGRLIECKALIVDTEALGLYNKEKPERRLFVSGLPHSVDDAVLKEAFEQFGPIEMCYTVKQKESQRFKGLGYVCFVKKSDRDTAVLAGKLDILGETVRCKEYRTKYALRTTQASTPILISQYDIDDVENLHKETQRKIQGKQTGIQSDQIPHYKHCKSLTPKQFLNQIGHTQRNKRPWLSNPDSEHSWNNIRLNYPLKGSQSFVTRYDCKRFLDRSPPTFLGKNYDIALDKSAGLPAVEDLKSFTPRTRVVY